MPRAPQSRRFVSLADAADYAACSQRTIRRQIAAGHLAGYRLGQMIRVDLDELDAMLEPIPTAGGAA